MGLTRVGANASVGQPSSPSPPLASGDQPYAAVHPVRAVCPGRRAGRAQGARLRHLRAGELRHGPSRHRCRYAVPGWLRHLLQSRRLSGSHRVACERRRHADQGGRHLHRGLDARQERSQQPLDPGPTPLCRLRGDAQAGHRIGLFAPYGLETRWPLSFDGRFSGFDNIIRNLYIQPTVAYQLTPKVSLGAGLDIVYGHVELNQRLDLSQQVIPIPGLPPGTTFAQFGIAPGTDFASSHLEASQTQVTGAHFGVIVKLNDRLSIGGRYLMHAKIDYTGTATFTQVPTGVFVPVTVTVGTG